MSSTLYWSQALANSQPAKADTDTRQTISQQIEALQARMLSIIDSGDVEENLDILAQLDSQVLALVAEKEKRVRFSHN